MQQSKDKHFGGRGKMKGLGFMPDGMYLALINWAQENNMSTRQLVYELVREGLRQKRNWDCRHVQKKFSRKIKMWYCPHCYVFFNVTHGPKNTLIYDEIRPVWERKNESIAGIDTTCLTKKN